VYVLLALLYRYAHKKRDELELNSYETLCTRNAIINFAGFAGIGVIVAIAAVTLPSQYAGYAGMLFSLNGVWGWLAGVTQGKQERLVLERMKSGSAAQAGR